MRLSVILGLTASVIALSTPGSSAVALDREVMSDEEMADARGGVLTAGGVAFEFGAIVRTFEDGVLSLQTQLTLTPQGPQVQQTLGPNVAQLGSQIAAQTTAQVDAALAAVPTAPGVASTSAASTPPAAGSSAPGTTSSAATPPVATPAPATASETISTPFAALGATAASTPVQAAQDLAAAAGLPVAQPIAQASQAAAAAGQAAAASVQAVVQSAMQSQVQAQTDTAGQVTVTPAAATPGQSLVNNSQAVYVTSSGASILQTVTNGQLLNVLMNTQNGHTFLQTTDITLVLPGFAGFQSGIMQQLTGMRLAADIRSAMAAGGN
jgi:hypothetical protein